MLKWEEVGFEAWGTGEDGSESTKEQRQMESRSPKLNGIPPQDELLSLSYSLKDTDAFRRARAALEKSDQDWVR